MQAAPTAQTVAPINAAKRPPSTVRASVAGGKIRLSGPSVPNRMVPVAVPPSTPAPAADASPSCRLPPRNASCRLCRCPRARGRPRLPPGFQEDRAHPDSAHLVARPRCADPAGRAGRRAGAEQPGARAPRPERRARRADDLLPLVAAPAGPGPSRCRTPSRRRPPGRPCRRRLSPAAPAAPMADERAISLSLAAVPARPAAVRAHVEPNAVPDDVRVTLPFALVEPQLAQGRVAVSPAVFAGALPESHREVLAANSGLSEIPLPLQEVFQNLPAAALAIRQDQVVRKSATPIPRPSARKPTRTPSVSAARPPGPLPPPNPRRPRARARDFCGPAVAR